MAHFPQSKLTCGTSNNNNNNNNNNNKNNNNNNNKNNKNNNNNNNNNIIIIIMGISVESTESQVELEFGNVGFCGGRKTGVHGEKPSEHG